VSLRHPTNLHIVPNPAPANRRKVLDAAVRVAFLQGIRRRGWTIEHAARECAASPSAVVKWLSGKRRIPATALFVVLDLGAANDTRRAA
jgi:hypothetical protein